MNVMASQGLKLSVQFDRQRLNGPFIFEWPSISRAFYFRSFPKRIWDLGTKMTIRSGQISL